MGYVGYDPCALGVLLGALDRALDERLPARPLSTDAGRRAFDRAVAAHRRQLIALGDVADLVGLVLRADPLGAYRIVAVDPHDLELWAYHRGGRWRTADDPTVTEAGWSGQFEVLNARLVAGWLTPDRWRELLDGEKEAAAPVLRYLSHLAGDAPARSAFLDAIGPEQVAALLRTASTRYTSTHLTDDADQPALRAVDALGALWAADRAQGGRRTVAWDTAALGGDLFAGARLLAIGAFTTGTLTSAELVRWGAALWRRLTSEWQPSELPRPELVGDQVLGALTGDGRAARGFLLELGEGPDLSDLAALLSNAFSTPSVSGGLLLASTDPSAVRTAADRDEVRRSVDAVLTVVDHLLAQRLAHAPAPDAAGQLTGRPGGTLPTGLGWYTGRQLVHLVDRCDGTKAACTPFGSPWPGWEEREVARLLERLVVDERIAAELQEAALAGWLARIAETDLLAPDAADVVQAETFAVGALDGIVGDQAWDRSRIDHERFQALVAGLDLAIDMASVGLAAIPRAVATAWGPVSDAGAALGPGSLGELALAFLRPEPAEEVRARTEAGQSLTTAHLKRTIAMVVGAQAGGRRVEARGEPVEVDVDRDAAALAAATRPGENANAGAYFELAAGDGRPAVSGPARKRIEQLQAVVGDTMAEGRAWVA
jgi:hypothetical protein